MHSIGISSFVLALFSVTWALNLEGDLDMLMTIGTSARESLFGSIPYASSPRSLDAISRIAHTKTPYFEECFYSQAIGKQDAQVLVDIAVQNPMLTKRILSTYCALRVNAIWNALEPRFDQYKPQFINIPPNAVCGPQYLEFLLKRCMENPYLIGTKAMMKLLDERFGNNAWMVTLGPRNLEAYKEQLHHNQKYAFLVGLGAFFDLEYSNAVSALSFLEEIFSKKYKSWYELLAISFRTPHQYFSAYKTILDQIKFCFENRPNYFSLWHTKLTLWFARRFYIEFINPGKYQKDIYRLVAYAQILRDFVDTNQSKPMVRPFYIEIHIAITELSKWVQDPKLESAKISMQYLPRQFQWLGTFEERLAAWRDTLMDTGEYVEWPPAFENRSDLIEFIFTRLITVEGLQFPLGNKLPTPVGVGVSNIWYTAKDLLRHTSHLLFNNLFSSLTPTTFLSKFILMPIEDQLTILWQIQANYLHFGQPLLPIVNASHESGILNIIWDLFGQFENTNLVLKYFTNQVTLQAQGVALPTLNNLLSRVIFQNCVLFVTFIIIFVFLSLFLKLVFGG